MSSFIGVSLILSASIVSVVLEEIPSDDLPSSSWDNVFTTNDSAQNNQLSK